MSVPEPFSKTGKPGDFFWDAGGMFYRIYWAGFHIPANLYGGTSIHAMGGMGQFPNQFKAAEAAVDDAEKRGLLKSSRTKGV